MRVVEGDIKQYWEGRLTLIPYYISCHINKIKSIQECTTKYNIYFNVLKEMNQTDNPKRMTIFSKAPAAFSLKLCK